MATETGMIDRVVSSTIDYATSPIIDPPATDFSDAEWKHTQSDSQPEKKRLDSDTTLTDKDQNREPGYEVQETEHAGTITPKKHRPTLSSQKYGTELAHPVGGKAFVRHPQRQSTGDIPRGGLYREQAQRSRSPSTDSSCSSQDDEGSQSTFKQAPRHKDLSKAHLNRVPRRPRNDKIHLTNEHFRGTGKVAKDGRLNISLNENANSGYLAKTLGATIKSYLHPDARQAQAHAEEFKKQYAANKAVATIPRMNVVIMVIGSRGDIQPFLKIGKILQDKYGHRVRIATHPAFKKFVEEEVGLEFFSVGGDPAELMAFMVKNPGLIPSFETIKAGEVGRRREQMFEMFQGFWRACINATDDERDTANMKMLGAKAPFVADAIIANPPSFAHFHCAEKLGIPLHLVFTFPYSPTQAFPHPLANIKASNVDREYTNFMSYPLVELMTWQGLGDLVNRFRVKTLGLEPVSTLWAPGQAYRLKIPTTYLWSPGLVPKPEDWGPEIDIAGYVFLDLASSYKPPDDLANFLKRDDDRPIIYIGFGSISGLDDPKAFCQMIFDAVVKAKVKAVVSRGWGGMGDGLDVPNGVFLIDNVPHDWLFPQMDAVVHHGGAGTTAAGLKFGKPTMIVPFFGDQPFWAAMVARAGAGAKEALPLKQLDSDKFAEGIRQCLEPEARKEAEAIAKSIEAEGDGAENAVDSFHRSLPLEGKYSMRCGIFDDRVSVWKVKHTDLRLSALAADLLVENRQLNWSDLTLLRHKDWTDFQGPGEPITGVGNVLLATFQEALYGLTSISDMTKKDMKRIDKHKRKGKTVADVVATPGHIAQRFRLAKQTSKMEKTDAGMNLHGDAEPPKRPGFEGQQDSSTRDGPSLLLRTTTTRSTDKGPQSMPLAIARDVGKGVGHSTKVVAMLPLHVMEAITLGLRNAPRLYGDRTVRPPPRAVSGVRSGLTTAGRELYFGFYDGAIGIIRIPRLDIQEEGLTGLPKGLSRGAGGLLLKPIAGIVGVPTYATKGCVVWLRKTFRDTERTQRWIRRARMAEGTKAVKKLQMHQSRTRTAPDGRPLYPQGSNENSGVDSHQLEEVRSTVLTKWTTRERTLVQEAREREQNGDVIARFKPSRTA